MHLPRSRDAQGQPVPDPGVVYLTRAAGAAPGRRIPAPGLAGDGGIRQAGGAMPPAFLRPGSLLSAAAGYIRPFYLELLETIRKAEKEEK